MNDQGLLVESLSPLSMLFYSIAIGTTFASLGFLGLMSIGVTAFLKLERATGDLDRID